MPYNRTLVEPFEIVKNVFVSLEYKQEDAWVGAYWREDYYCKEYFICIIPFTPICIRVEREIPRSSHEYWDSPTMQEQDSSRYEDEIDDAARSDYEAGIMTKCEVSPEELAMLKRTKDRAFGTIVAIATAIRFDDYENEPDLVQKIKGIVAELANTKYLLKSARTEFEKQRMVDTERADAEGFNRAKQIAIDFINSNTSYSARFYQIQNVIIKYFSEMTPSGKKEPKDDA